MRLRLLRGADISSLRCADALVTSANAGLVGNANPRFWRFAGRNNVDGAMHRAAGPDLQAACAVLAAAAGEATPCSVGHAVVTPAFGLHAALVVHAVAPDGAYAVGLQQWWGRRHWSGAQRYGSTGARHVYLEEARPAGEAQLLLGNTYAAVMHSAERQGVRSIAVPAIGCGVLGFRQESVAQLALGVIASHVANREGASLDRVDVALPSDAAFEAWRAAAERLVGPPRSTGTAAQVYELGQAVHARKERAADFERYRTQALDRALEKYRV
jgi:O-acetyl-ADP-ribose deacetylase (regulator of RNase III)